jgi:xanthine dehydrogenase YagS FAD-binding subunit
LRIGALVTLAEIADSAAVKREFPALSATADDAASPQLRHMGTIGGNLCQRPRCWYYRNGFGLFARDANGNSLVPNGENRYHAILGNDGPAYFVNPSTVAPLLIALGAKIKLAGKSGEREMELKDFFVIPKRDSDREHAIKPDEILTEVIVPSAARGMRSATYEVRQKMELDWPLATASVALFMDGNRVRAAKIVLGHVAPIPWVADAAAASLAGKTITEQNAAEAGAAAVAGAKPLSQNAYKVQIAKVCVKRALLQAAKEGA